MNTTKVNLIKAFTTKDYNLGLICIVSFSSLIAFDFMPHLSGEKKRLPDKNLAKKRQNQLRNENLIEWDVRFLNEMMIKISFRPFICAFIVLRFPFFNVTLN